MKVLGITGGVGSGKSKAASMLHELLESELISTDDVARELMNKGKVSYNRVVNEFGTEILDDDEEIDRKKLANIVFNHKDKLELLNSFTHEHVIAKVNDIMKKSKKEDKPLVIIESALFKEAGFENICDEVWYINTPDDIRRIRLKESRGYSDEKISAIFENQYSCKEYKDASTVVINNSGDVEELKNSLLKELSRFCKM